MFCYAAAAGVLAAITFSKVPSRFAHYHTQGKVVHSLQLGFYTNTNTLALWMTSSLPQLANWRPVRFSMSLCIVAHTQGKVVHSFQLGFYTNTTVLDSVPTGGFNGTGDGAGAQPDAPSDCAKVGRVGVG